MGYRILGRIFGVLVAIFALCLMLSPYRAEAFSGYGSGTNSAPYQIETCAQLQSIQSNLSAEYILVGDIDCSGVTFTPIGPVGSPFTGVLNGQNFTISNLVITGRSDWTALFASTTGATIKNLHLASSTFSSSDAAAGLVVYATDTTVTAISVESTINSGSWGAGLVTVGHGSTSISKSEYNGTVTAVAYAAGLMSVAYDTISISDSRVRGTMNTDIYPGSIIGGMAFGNTATVSRVYSTATINANGVYIGGAFGTIGGAPTLTDIFYAGVMNVGSSTYHGALAGTTDGDETWVRAYYDAATCGSCTDGGIGTATLEPGIEEVAGDPGYFKGNSTNEPLDHFNFSSVWATVASGYPILIAGTAPVVPSVPANFTATKVGDSVLLTWGAPVTAGSGTRFDYRLQYKTNTDSDWTTYTHTANPNLTSVTLATLTPSKTYSFRLQALNSIVYGTQSTLANAATIVGGVVTGLPSGLALKEANTDADLTTSDSTGTVTAKLVDTSTGLTLSTFTIDLSTNRVLSGITGSVDQTTGKTVITGISSVAGAAATHTLYVPKLANQTQFRVCPNAATLSEVTTDCTAGINYSEGDANVTVVTVGSQSYWVIAGMTGTGGVGITKAVAATTVTASPSPSSTSSTANTGATQTLAETGDSLGAWQTIALLVMAIGFSGLIYTRRAKM